MGMKYQRSCYQYISDLAAGEDYPNYSKGVPRYAKLECKTVKRKLKVFKL